jgi:hypothetical protein
MYRELDCFDFEMPGRIASTPISAIAVALTSALRAGR